jgi:hypothetical protein
VWLGAGGAERRRRSRAARRGAKRSSTALAKRGRPRGGAGGAQQPSRAVFFWENGITAGSRAGGDGFDPNPTALGTGGDVIFDPTAMTLSAVVYRGTFKYRGRV